MNFFRRLVIILVLLGGSGLLVVYSGIQIMYAHRIVASESVSSRPVALVFGSSVKSRKPNSILQERLDTAAALYSAGKVKKMLLSGDNRTVDYNEPQAMKVYLMSKGVPEGDLILDHAGRRTYDSCYRARYIFNLNSVIIVTQTFHLPRALYLCDALGLDAMGIAADEEYPIAWWQGYIREVPATIQAWIDITFRKPLPLLGKPEKVF